MSENKTTYESLDGKIAPEALLKDTRGKLQMVDGHGIKQEADYDDPDKLYGMLIARIQKYHPSADVTQIEKAYNLAKKAHGDQKRKSGEPYIIHPLWVAIILADLEMDKETIIAALLHDVVEDTRIGEDYIKEEFGEEVALLVDGVTKLGRVAYSADKLELQAENLRKMFLAMAKDIRVIIIKLADRLHNMRTLQFMTPAKQQEKARETMDIYAPIAGRLGISKIKTELDDLSLKYLKPDVFFDLVNQINARKTEREEFVQQIVDEVSMHMKNAGIKADVNGRVKHFFSIYKKMVNQDKTVDQIYDLFAVRIIVDSVKDCYAALGIIHEIYTPIPGRFKDYIAMPKPNMYQSLHTTVLGDNGEPFEIQIRTYEMHRVAEYGIAAHWKYKEGKTSGDQNQEEMKLAWVRQTLEWHKELNDPKEFMETLKMDLFATQVFVFTPKGEVIDLPAGSTPLDFAFKIHTAVGCKCVGAKVNGKMVTIDHVLNNGDIVEIVTSSNSSGPSIDWLKIAKSSTARTKIRQWLKKESKPDDVARGKDALDKYIRKKGFDPQLAAKSSYLNKAMREMNISTMDEVYIQLSKGGTVLSKYANLLFSYFNEEKKQEQRKEEEKQKKVILWVLAIIGLVAAVAAIAYGVYKFVTPDYLEDFEDDFDDDFDDYFSEEDQI